MIGGLWWFFIGQALPRDRVQPALRPDRRADGVPGRVRHAGRAGARRADPGAAPAVDRRSRSPTATPAEIVLGVLFLAVILFLPRGIVPTGAESLTRWRAVRASGAAGRARPGRAGPGRARGTAAGRRGHAGHGTPTGTTEHGRRAMTALLRTDGGEQGVRRRPGARAGPRSRWSEGSIAGLIGPNGSGKTTLFNVITGYETGGRRRRLPGRPAGSPTPRRTRCSRPGIGRTFQLTRVFSRLTVMENMIVAAQHAERRAAGGCATRWPGRAARPPGAGRWSCWSSPASSTTPARWPRRCPTASASCWSCPTC